MKHLFIKLWRRQWPLLLSLALMIPSILPFFKPGLFPMHDWTQVVRVAEMRTALIDGHFPVRWSRHLGFGYGMPLFSFYAPLPYYVGVGLTFMGLSETAAVKVLFILTFAGSLIGIYLIAKKYFGMYGGLLAAVAFTYLPYRAVNVYVRGALSELFGMMFFVWCWWALGNIRDKKNWLSVVWLGAAVTGFLLSHNLMVVMGTPFLLVYGMYVWGKEKPEARGRLVIRSLTAGLIGVLLSSFYLLPLVAEKHLTAVDALTTQGGDYRQHFVYLRQLWQSPFAYGGSLPGLLDGMSFELGKFLVVLALIAFGGFIGGRKKKLLGWIGLVMGGLIGALFMTNERSLWLWQTFGFLSYLQFPWRYLFVAGFFLSLIIGMLPVVFRRLPALVWVGLAVGMVVAGESIFNPDPELPSDSHLYKTSSKYITETVSKTLPEYMPLALVEVVMAQEKEIQPVFERLVFEGETGSPTEWHEDTTHRFAARIYPLNNGVARVNIFTYPGWQFSVDGMGVEPQVGGSLPVYEIPVQASETQGILIKGELKETPFRAISNTISFSTMVGLVGYVVARKVLMKDQS
jgi:hypothetical protein